MIDFGDISKPHTSSLGRQKCISYLFYGDCKRRSSIGHASVNPLVCSFENSQFGINGVSLSKDNLCCGCQLLYPPSLFNGYDNSPSICLFACCLTLRIRTFGFTGLIRNWVSFTSGNNVVIS